MNLDFSFIIPVYNRPDEIQELLQSFSVLEGDTDFEIVIVEDGSEQSSKTVVEAFSETLNISYFYKENSGPGDSRNYGMKRAKGNYFIILGSYCFLPPQYLNAVKKSLEADYVDCFGGPDAAHESFTNLQKAINFSMTSFITTGGIRGSKNSVDKFQPRSFNMGLSKKASEASRLCDLGFKTKLIPEAYVFHKRRISWSTFYKQVHKFGLVRPILNAWHPSTSKITYWFPAFFILGLVLSLVLLWFQINGLFKIYVVYFALAFILALLSTSSLVVALLSIAAILVQFLGYGYGFLKSTWAVAVLNKNPERHFPKLFFKRT